MKENVQANPYFYPNPVVLVSVKSGVKESIITIAWTGTCCSDPPYVSIGVRPNRYSYQLLKESNECVINFPTKSMLEEVKLCGTKSGRNTNKWEECQFTKTKSREIDVPLIAECPVNMECKIEQMIPLGTHDLFIARVVSLHIDPDWKQTGYPEMLTFTRGKYGVVKNL
jgi:flavin reductase (DIM6/NTAB) family NADH-FMN oxidoreductase RutF